MHLSFAYGSPFSLSGYSHFHGHIQQKNTLIRIKINIVVFLFLDYNPYIDEYHDSIKKLRIHGLDHLSGHARAFFPARQELATLKRLAGLPKTPWPYSLARPAHYSGLAKTMIKAGFTYIRWQLNHPGKKLPFGRSSAAPDVHRGIETGPSCSRCCRTYRMNLT
jgi:hypothetical protein